MVVATAPQPAIVGRYSVLFAASGTALDRPAGPAYVSTSINATNGTVAGQALRDACDDDKLSP